MVFITSIIGALLIALGVFSFVSADATAAAKITSLIPAVVGVLLVVLAAAGSQSDKARKHAMHAAVLLTTVGFVLAMWRLMELLFRGDEVKGHVVLGLAGMAILCLTHVWLSVRSFIAARRARQAVEQPEVSEG